MQPPASPRRGSRILLLTVLLTLAMLAVPVTAVAWHEPDDWAPPAPPEPPAPGPFHRLVDAAVTAGFSGEELHIAVAIAFAESEGRESVRSEKQNADGTYDWGAWQINDRWQDLGGVDCFTEYYCAASVVMKLRQTPNGWKHWTVYRTGVYQDRWWQAAEAIAAWEAVVYWQPPAPAWQPPSEGPMPPPSPGPELAAW